MHRVYKQMCKKQLFFLMTNFLMGITTSPLLVPKPGRHVRWKERNSFLSVLLP